MRVLLKFLKLPLTEKVLYAEALPVVFFTGIVLRVVPFRFLRKLLVKRLSTDAMPGSADLAEIQKIVRSVDFFSRFHPFATCLTRSLSALLLIKFNGEHAILKIGVAKDEDTTFKAHAWLESNGRIVIGKIPSASQYTVLDSFSG
jgi:hypothetical protein